MAFQNLEDDIDQENVPYVAPWIDYYHVSDIDRFGGRTDLQLDTVALTRAGGNRHPSAFSARAVGAAVHRSAWATSSPSTAALWSDGYNVDDQTTPSRRERLQRLQRPCFPAGSRHSGGCR